MPGPLFWSLFTFLNTSMQVKFGHSHVNQANLMVMMIKMINDKHTNDKLATMTATNGGDMTMTMMMVVLMLERAHHSNRNTQPAQHCVLVMQPTSSKISQTRYGGPLSATNVLNDIESKTLVVNSSSTRFRWPRKFAWIQNSNESLQGINFETNSSWRNISTASWWYCNHSLLKPSPFSITIKIQWSKTSKVFITQTRTLGYQCKSHYGETQHVVRDIQLSSQKYR